MPNLVETVAFLEREIVEKRAPLYLDANMYSLPGHSYESDLKRISTVTSDTLQMLAHDLVNKFRSIEGFAEAILEFNLPSELEENVMWVHLASSEFSALIQKAAYQPSILLTQTPNGTRVIDTIYDHLLLDIDPRIVQEVPTRFQDEVKDYMHRIERAQSQAQKLIQAHLNYGHKVGHFELAEYVQSLEGQFASVLPPSIPLTLPTPIVSIVDNLAGNAVKANASVLQVGYTHSVCGQYTHIRVTDNGDGVPDHAIPTLFEGISGFKSSGTKTTHGQNSGLGLSHSRRVARLYGGDLRLHETIPGQGTTFELTIPSKYVNQVPNLAN